MIFVAESPLVGATCRRGYEGVVCCWLFEDSLGHVSVDTLIITKNRHAFALVVLVLMFALLWVLFANDLVWRSLDEKQEYVASLCSVCFLERGKQEGTGRPLKH